MRKTDIIIIIILISIDVALFANEAIHVYPDENKVTLEEVFIELNKYDLELSSGNSIFIRLEETYSSIDNIAQWDFDALENLMEKEKSVPVCGTEIPIYLERLVYKDIKGEAAVKTSRELKLLSIDDLSYTILEIPICSDKVIEDDEIIQLYDLPIIFKDDKFSETKLQIGTGKSVGLPFGNTSVRDGAVKRHISNIHWQDIDYLISRGSTKIELAKNYKVISSNDPFNIDIKLIDDGPASVTAGRDIIFTLDNNAEWGDNLNSIVVKTDNIISRENYMILNGKERSKLVFNFKNDIHSAQILFQNLPIVYNSDNIEIKVSLFSKFNISLNPHSNKLNIFEKIFRKIFKSKNITNLSYSSIKKASETEKFIDVFNIDFKINNPDNGVYSLNLENNENTLPTIALFQNEKNAIMKGQVLSIIIPNNVKLSWNIKQLDNKNYTIREITEKTIQLSVNDAIHSNNALFLEQLSFNHTENVVPPFQLQLKMHGFSNIKNIKSANSFTIANLDFGIDSPLYLYTSIDQPSIGSFYIMNNGYIVPGDILTIDISDSKDIKFDLDKKYRNSFENELKIILEQQKIIIRVLEPLPINKKIVLDEISLKKLSVSEQVSYPKLNYHPGQYKSIRKDAEKVSKYPINIISLEVDFANSIEYINDIEIKNQIFDVPDISIFNNSYLSTPNFESLILSFPHVDDYFIFDSELNISTNQDLDKPIIIEGKDNISLILNRPIEPQEKIIINGLKIRLISDEPSFDSEKLILQIKGAEAINVKTKHTIGYGTPKLISNMDQQFYVNRQFERLYEMTINLKQLPLTAARLNQIVLKIPDNVNISWENNNIVNIATDNAQTFFTSKPYTSNDGKEIFIPFEMVPEKMKGKVYLGNLYFKSVGDITENFHIQMSLDEGETFSSKDEKTKKVISQTEMSDIIIKEINEKWFPFKKGNKLVFAIPSNSSYQWIPDTSKSIYHKYSAITEKSKMFSDPEIAIDNKKIILSIINDVEIPSSSQMMDFGQKLRLALPIQSNGGNIKIPNITMTLESIYGIQKLKNGIEWEDVLFKFKPELKNDDSHQFVDISVELSNHPDYSNEIIQWHRAPGNLLFHTGLDHRGAGFVSSGMTEKEKLVKLSYIKNELEKHYNNYQKVIDNDWIFWYYLGRFKYEIEAIQGENYQQTFRYGRLNELDYWRDIDHAKNIGYADAEEQQLWNPVKGLKSNEAEEIFNQIYSYFNDGNYPKADFLLFKELYLTRRLDDLDDHIEISARYLDVIISHCFYEDDNILRKGRKYVKHQIFEIDKLMKSDANLINILNNFGKNFPYLNDINEYYEPIVCSNYPQINSDNFVLNSSSSISIIDTASIRLSLQDKMKYVEKFEDKLFFNEYISSTDSVATELDFGDSQNLYGGKTYGITYDPDKQNYDRLKYMTGASLIFLLLLLI